MKAKRIKWEYPWENTFETFSYNVNKSSLEQCSKEDFLNNNDIHDKLYPVDDNRYLTINPYNEEEFDEKDIHKTAEDADSCSNSDHDEGNECCDNKDNECESWRINCAEADDTDLKADIKCNHKKYIKVDSNTPGECYRVDKKSFHKMSKTAILDGFYPDKDREKTVIGKPIGGSQPKGIIFECDTGQGAAIVPNKGEALSYNPRQICVAKTLGSIAIDTTCLKKPKIKVQFSCSIFFAPKVADAVAQLEFVMSRSCNNGQESSVGNWTYEISEGSMRDSQPFRFSLSSCSSFPGCYNYYVRVLPIYIKNCIICITGCQLNAVAQSR
jgi:hypothetical protein